MQFKYPSLLYLLILLIIPILVHLFQLQRFVKISFTNVAFLKKIAIQTRKSSKIKKLLILLTRILSLGLLIFAFAQPYLSNNTADTKQHTFIYLDNSLSLTGKGDKGSLLQSTKNDIIAHCSNKSSYSLMTNDNYYKNINAQELKENLKQLSPSIKKVNFNEILLKITNESKKNNTLNEHVLISDFQNTTADIFKNKKLKLLALQHVDKNNIAIDSVYLDNNSNQTFNVAVVVRNYGSNQKNIPIAIYNNELLISKQSFDITKNSKKTIYFSVQKTQTFLGKLSLNFSDSFNFDNNFYFTVNTNTKTNVLCLGEKNSFLKKLYHKNEFNFTETSIKKVNYNSFNKQQLIILNELDVVPETLISSIKNFIEQGGNIIVIPSNNSNIDSYSNLLNTCNAGKLVNYTKDSLKITKIHFSHPLLKNVFDKKINNFQYPLVKSYFNSNLKNTSTIISFENNTAFISEIKLKKGSLFWVSAPLNKENSNFKNSPLIVPVFYNIGQQSLKVSKLYYDITENNKIDIITSITKNELLEIKGKKQNFVPLQQTSQNKVTITTNDKPNHTGIYAIIKQKDTLKAIAFNIPNSESSQNFLDTKNLKNNGISISNNIKDTFNAIDNQTDVNWLWKWFLIGVLLFLLLEILILKFFKP